MLKYVRFEENMQLLKILFTVLLFTKALALEIIEEEIFFGSERDSECFTQWGGIALSSFVFATSHLTDARFLEPQERWRYYTRVIPVIGAVGAYQGWLTSPETVTINALQDFAIFLISSLASDTVQPNFSTSISF